MNITEYKLHLKEAVQQTTRVRMVCMYLLLLALIIGCGKVDNDALESVLDALASKLDVNYSRCDSGNYPIALAQGGSDFISFDKPRLVGGYTYNQINVSSGGELVAEFANKVRAGYTLAFFSTPNLTTKGTASKVVFDKSSCSETFTVIDDKLGDGTLSFQTLTANKRPAVDGYSTTFTGKIKFRSSSNLAQGFDANFSFIRFHS